MLRKFGIAVAGLAGLLVVLALAFVLIGRERSLEMAFGPIDRAPVDFATVDTTGRLNTYLVCPTDQCRQTPDRASPVFGLPVSELRARWMSVIAVQPRVEQIAADEALQQLDFIQRTALMRYPDTITIRFVPLDEGRSTVAIFSRSHYGRSDFGVNRARIEAWLAELPGTEN